MKAHYVLLPSGVSNSLYQVFWMPQDTYLSHGEYPLSSSFYQIVHLSLHFRLWNSITMLKYSITWYFIKFRVGCTILQPAMYSQSNAAMWKISGCALSLSQPICFNLSWPTCNSVLPVLASLYIPSQPIMLIRAWPVCYWHCGLIMPVCLLIHWLAILLTTSWLFCYLCP
jgi:hypothetical protein